MLVNAFWLWPFVNRFKQKAGVVTSSKVNQLANENNLLKTQKYGDFESVSLVKGFSFDYTDWQTEDESGYMMQEWRDQFEKIEVEVIGWMFFVMAVMGLVVMAREKKKEFYPFGVLFGLGFFDARESDTGGGVVV